MSKTTELFGKVWVAPHGHCDIEVRTAEWEEALAEFSDGEKVKIIITSCDE